MNCPNCNETLVMTDRQGVEIDYCPKCRGVWLDRGELDKIIERSASLTPPPQDYNQGSGKDYYNDDRKYYPNQPGYNPKYKKKKDSFLGDLFDF